MSCWHVERQWRHCLQQMRQRQVEQSGVDFVDFGPVELSSFFLDFSIF
jgi:hypothetical protein